MGHLSGSVFSMLISKDVLLRFVLADMKACAALAVQGQDPCMHGHGCMIGF